MWQLYPVLVPLLVGIIFGATTISIAVWRILRSRIEAGTRETREAQIELATLREQNTRVPELQESVKSGAREIQRLGEEASALQSKLAVSQSDAQNQLKQNESLRTEVETLRDQIKQSNAEQERLKVGMTTLSTELEVERRQTPEKTAFLNDLANQILEDSPSDLLPRIRKISISFLARLRRNFRNFSKELKMSTTKRARPEPRSRRRLSSLWISISSFLGTRTILRRRSKVRVKPKASGVSEF